MSTKNIRKGPRIMQIAMYIQECSKCGMPFATTMQFDNERRNDNRVFYCPKGHEQSYVDEYEETENE